MSIVAITGVASYFAHGLLPLLEANENIEKIVGLDIRKPLRSVSKLDFYYHDIRNPHMGPYFEKADTVLHLAFIVDEIKDKSATRAINVEGSKNLLRALQDHPPKKLIYTSSIAAYGSHPDNPMGMNENHPLQQTKDCYYSVDKVAVEEIFQDYRKTHPEILLTILRPCWVVGPNAVHMIARMFQRKIIPGLIRRDPLIQFLHEDDLSRALHQTVTEDLPGIFNVAGSNPVLLSRLVELSGALAIPLPDLLARKGANILFRLGLLPFSEHWVSMQKYPVTVSTEKLEKEFGWPLQYSTEEAFCTMVNPH